MSSEPPSRENYGWLVFAVEIVLAVAVVVAAHLWQQEYTPTQFSHCEHGVPLPRETVGNGAGASSSSSAAAPSPSTTRSRTPPSGLVEVPPSSSPGPNLATPAGNGTNPPEAVLNFGRQEGPKGTIVVLSGASGVDLSQPPVVIGEARRGNAGGAVFARDQIDLGVTKRGDAIEVNVCGNRKGAADPGSYHGQIEAFTGTGTVVVVPLSITLADTNTEWVVLAAVIIVLVGNLYLFALFAQLAPHDEVAFDTLSQYVYWCGEVKSIVAGVFGLAAAATVFNAQYLASDAFGSSPWQYPTLMVSMLAAFVGAGSTASVPFSGRTASSASGSGAPA